MQPEVETNSTDVVMIGFRAKISFQSFFGVVYGGSRVALTEDAKAKLTETRQFIDHLVAKKAKVYGLTTGFADLRNCCVPPEHAAQLSRNIIASHDAGIGNVMNEDITIGAMLLRAHALGQGNSGFKLENLLTLIEMINARIIPQVPETGSLGASGDLCYLARLGRAMEGSEVLCDTPNGVLTAEEALRRAEIRAADFGSKDGLALTNGTSFMCSMLAIGYLRQVRVVEDLLAMEGLFLNAYHAVDAAFFDSVHSLRALHGQDAIARLLRSHLEGSPFADTEGVQNDYCIRCLPQILGPLYEELHSCREKIVTEMNSVTDNPLIFRGSEISEDVPESRIHTFQDERWAVLSGGNFHGEPLAQMADTFCRLNAKWAYTFERQATYMLNPSRHKQDSLPAYLCTDKENLGLLSGFMIVQYTSNALAQKIAFLGNPTSIFNITSGNESEDVVSYGAAASQNWLRQLDLIEQFAVTFLTSAAQAYAIARQTTDSEEEGELSEDLYCEKMFAAVQSATNDRFPTLKDVPFGQIYEELKKMLAEGSFRMKWIRNPLRLAGDFWYLPETHRSN